MAESWEEFGGEDAGKDKSGAAEGAWAEVLVQEDERNEPGENGLQRKDERGV